MLDGSLRSRIKKNTRNNVVKIIFCRLFLAARRIRKKVQIHKGKSLLILTFASFDAANDFENLNQDIAPFECEGHQIDPIL